MKVVEVCCSCLRRRNGSATLYDTVWEFSSEPEKEPTHLETFPLFPLPHFHLFTRSSLSDPTRSPVRREKEGKKRQ